MTKIIITFLFVCLFKHSVYAQNLEKSQLDNRINLMFGLGQIVADGFNIEGNVFYERIAFDYSHGVSLNTANSQLENGKDKEQGLAIHIPWTTGFGIGYRFNEWLNLRIEPKAHKYELYYDGDTQSKQNLIANYTTYTLGLGLYTNLRPFKKQDNFLRGIILSPNVRWWPRIASNIKNDQLQYKNRLTNELETHTARQIGIANTAFFGNMSIGYSVLF